MATEAAGGDNGRVTMALLGAQQAEMMRRMDDIRRLLEQHIAEQARAHADIEKRIHADELAAQDRETRLGQVECDVEKLQTKSTVGDGVNSFLAIVAGLVAWFKT